MPQVITHKSVTGGFFSFNLKTAVGREKAVQAIDVHREWGNCVVTFWVMSQFPHFLGAVKRLCRLS